jgi:YebC/PmpR family DNA-binding regulatory protein
MSGHSKWSTIKRKKGATDQKRGKIFGKIIKEITIAARIGGGDIDANPRLRQAIAGAKSVNMPADNMTKAIKKGTGELPGVTIEEVSYEGYGPGGVALFIHCATDNKNRTLPEIRAMLGKGGGSLGTNGSVSYLFDSKGLIVIPASQISEEDLMDTVLDAGAEDMTVEDDTFEVITSVESFEDVRKAVENKNLSPTTCELTMIPQTTIQLDETNAAQVLKLMDTLDDQEDVQKVYANFDISDEILEKIAG